MLVGKRAFHFLWLSNGSHKLLTYFKFLLSDVLDLCARTFPLTTFYKNSG
jgi:hypothetical protein